MADEVKYNPNDMLANIKALQKSMFERAVAHQTSNAGQREAAADAFAKLVRAEIDVRTYKKSWGDDYNAN